MPTNYTPDPTIAQAPSAIPEPENYPTLAIPNAGEGATVSSISQFVKALGDHLAWLKKPRAKASSWAQAIMRFRNAGLHTRFAIDHLGLPGGHVIQKDILWERTLDSIGGTAAGTAFAAMPDFKYFGLDTGPGSSSASISFADFGQAALPCLALRSAATGGDFAAVCSALLGAFKDVNHWALDFMAAAGNGFDERDVVIGLGEYLGADPDATQDFIGFKRIDSINSNWHAVTRFGGLPGTVTDTGVAIATGSPFPTSWDRLRVEWHGATVADNGTRAVRFYVNGALVATHTTNLPIDKNFNIIVGDTHATGVANNVDFYVGPMRLRGNIFALDVHQ